MARVTAVAEHHPLLKDTRFRPQHHFHAPLHTVYAIHVAHHHRGAAVLMFGKRKIHRGKRHPIVGNRKVILHSECSPRSSVSDVRLLDGRVGIKHLPAIDLVEACIKVSPEVRQDRAFQVLVFQEHCTLWVLDAPVRQIGSQRVRIIEPVCCQLIEWGVRIRRTLFIYRQRKRPLPDTNLGRSSRAPASPQRDHRQLKENQEAEQS